MNDLRANGSHVAVAVAATLALLVTLPGARAAEPASGTGVAAASAAPAQASPSKNKASDPMICRTESDIGSRISTRKCRRKSEIDAEARESQQRIQDGVRGTARPGPNSTG